MILVKTGDEKGSLRDTDSADEIKKKSTAESPYSTPFY